MKTWMVVLTALQCGNLIFTWILIVLERRRSPADRSVSAIRPNRVVSKNRSMWEPRPSKEAAPSC